MSTQPQQPIRFYRHPLSGHCHRVQLLLSMLQLPYEVIEVDLAHGEHKSPAFLKLNPFGLLPVIDDGGTVVADSAAILVYLNQRYGSTRYLPESPAGQAAVQRWLAIAAGPLTAGPATARIANVFGKPLDRQQAILSAHELFKVIEGWLTERDFLAADHETLADIALYAYVAHAPEGDISLEPYPHIRAWLNRIEALPGFVPMQRTAVGLAA
ncbi:glutathione S-transferase [Silvimonas sp.]|uniref:glutathione S-transferase family protein n=1 Tax=Silvimonas sp. TaxID=2650811 RepID=UPI0028458B5B|nr:glutathione S-transferase [Silvimonas sp.]MDR3426514.1 glutathione S-transferase [Silvimonas sp.]